MLIFIQTADLNCTKMKLSVSGCAHDSYHSMFNHYLWRQLIITAVNQLLQWALKFIATYNVIL